MEWKVKLPEGCDFKTLQFQPYTYRLELDLASSQLLIITDRAPWPFNQYK